jgi:hypothetical protein
MLRHGYLVRLTGPGSWREGVPGCTCEGVGASREPRELGQQSGWGPSDVPETLAAQEVFEFDLAVLLFVVVVRSAPALPVQHLR